MINPISSADTNKKNIHEKYKDPLSRKLPVLMSYSSEVGTAISEIAPKLGASLFAPTFMYLGEKPKIHAGRSENHEDICREK